MIERLIALGTDYVGTLGALARTEAAEDTRALRGALGATLFAVVVIATGALWFNVAVLLWLLSTGWAIPGAFAIAAVALLAGIALGTGARRRLSALRPMQATRRVLAEALGGGDPGLPRAAVSPIDADEAGARLRSIREALRRTLVQELDPLGGASGTPTAPRFVPRSRTMRSALWLWRAIPQVPSATAVTGALGVMAVGSPRVRRLLALVALLRNLGGHRRQSARGGARSRRA